MQQKYFTFSNNLSRKRNKACFRRHLVAGWHFTTTQRYIFRVVKLFALFLLTCNSVPPKGNNKNKKLGKLFCTCYDATPSNGCSTNVIADTCEMERKLYSS